MDVAIHIDLGSPYAYLAWCRVRRHPERYAGAKLRWVPVSAAHLFRMDGTVPNMTLPNQSRYLMEDVARWAERLEVPFRPPQAGSPGAMPTRSIEAMRLAFLAEAEGRQEAWIDAVYAAYFGDGLDISDAAVLDDLAAKVGLSQGSDAAGDGRWKQALIDSTSAAYVAGAPGVPFTVVEDAASVERFWGQDRLDWVEARIAAARPVTT